MTDEQALKEAQDRERREQQQKLRLAQLARVRYDLALVDLGLDEVPVLHYAQHGIEPQMRVVPLTDEQAKETREHLTKLKADLEAMGGLA